MVLGAESQPLSIVWHYQFMSKGVIYQRLKYKYQQN